METEETALQSSHFTLLALRKTFSQSATWIYRRIQKWLLLFLNLPLAEQPGKDMLIISVVQCTEVEPAHRELCGNTSV